MAPDGGKRRNQQEERERILALGRAEVNGTDNSVRTSKYTIFTFFPIAIAEQFRRNGNVYFLVIGCLMAIGWYTDAFDSAISPWTTLGPLAVVVSISLLQEGIADMSRHRSDDKTNNYPCVILASSSDLDGSEGKRPRDANVRSGRDVEVNLNRNYNQPSAMAPGPASSRTPSIVKVAFESVRRKNIYAGNLVLVRNREMVPADIILLASSSEGGSAYIETSSIDGETNLKLRTSPHLPSHAVGSPSHGESDRSLTESSKALSQVRETLVQATKRVTRFSSLGYPSGVSALKNPANLNEEEAQPASAASFRGLKGKRASAMNVVGRLISRRGDGRQSVSERASVYGPGTKYVAALTSEPPNASVNTFSGKLTLPPLEDGSPSVDIPLNAENILLRGAVLRNTEWALGVACFTGDDTKLVQNSFKTPSKFSKLDQIMNKTVILILCVMLACVMILAGLSVSTSNSKFDTFWYLGFKDDPTAKWPYLQDLNSPDWDEKTPNYGQQMFLYITLLNNFVPLSLYVTVEMITFALMFFINLDVDMYHEETDTPASARSTIVTDLGQVQYVFSDKTGTLTRNVMRFKRCSVDGMVFGTPIAKSAPSRGEDEDDQLPQTPFHPLKQLLVSAVQLPEDSGLDGFSGPDEKSAVSTGSGLTFNAEMFLRVMSLCHTVVVEKEFDPSSLGEDSQKKSESSGNSVTSSVGKYFKLRKRKGSSDTNSSTGQSQPERSDKEEKENGDNGVVTIGKSLDGAPSGHTYQAESPDEGALVSAASLTYGFQFVGRDSTGVQLAVCSPSMLEDERIVSGIKKGSLSAKALAADTARPATDVGTRQDEGGGMPIGSEEQAPRMETWTILAVNKFDSDRKRMSVVVRSPPELGSVPMILCKGADSSMLDPDVCEGGQNIMNGDEERGGSVNVIERPVHEREGSGSGHLPCLSEDAEENVEVAVPEEENWDASAMLGIQAHLGDFASEGLRTLVLGVRILGDEECEEWLEKHKEAAASIKDRDRKLTEVAFEIERGLHIVGATAIEDKLQRGVPETIASLEQAGVKLWVLTGDKRETAIEIGYSTQVLTPKMHLTEVAAAPAQRVKTLMAMEFIRLIKSGKLGQYQKSALEMPKRTSLWALFGCCKKRVGWLRRLVSRSFRRFYYKYIKGCICGRKSAVDSLDRIDEEEKEEKEKMMDPKLRRRAVRDMAEKIIEDYLQSSEGIAERARRRRRSQQVGPDGDASRRGSSVDDDLSLTSDALPAVFNRAQSAKLVLDSIRNSSGRLSQADLRSLSLLQMTSQRLVGDAPLVDEDTLSLRSFLPGGKSEESNTFDRKKRTLLERLFSVDREVRKGRLTKHLKKEKLEHVPEDLPEGEPFQVQVEQEPHHLSSHGPRALVIEGAALAPLLGDKLLEEILFSVASSCDSVIACRVSPKQKALLVKLVRNYVLPTPVTLAIGDGANDVGMIQEAHVGVGISGLEGQQAVNASDFAIAQFRFLEDLLLVHGRWNFIRMSKAVLFSFYKNAVLAGLMMVFQGRTLFSGTPLFDMWVISMFNFVAGVPILLLGFFDRDIEKDYVKRNPEVFASSRRNEYITLRTILRWVCLTVVHVFVIYFLSAPALANGASVTAAFEGLMGNVDRDVPGDGEAGNLKTFGTTIFTILIITLAYKILYESRSLIHGVWPAFTCRKGVGEGWPNRIAYTWVGVSWLSIGFLFFALYIYQLIGKSGASTFSPFVMVTYHVFNTRSITWMLLILVPTAACACDVMGKVYGNMWFPTQTQIHIEIAAKEVADSKKREKALQKEGKPSDDVV